jgi:hypothetical protein
MKLTAIVLLALATTVAAGDRKKQQQAWDAYRAGKSLDRGAVPRLTEMIRHVPKRKDQERCLVVRAAFDALIRLGAPVPTKILGPHLRGPFRTQALILVARHAADHTDTLLETFDVMTAKTMGPFGIAVGNLLCSAKVPGFAPRLVRRVEMKLKIVVADERTSIGLGGGRSGGFGDGLLLVPEGYPPTVFYKLSTLKKLESVLVADGPHPVYYERRERKGRHLGVGGGGFDRNTQDLVREWLGVLVGRKASDLGIPEKRNLSIAYESPEHFTAEAKAARDRLLANHGKLVKALVAKNLVSEAEAKALKPRLNITVDDRRKKKDPPLPKFPAPAKAE